MAIPHIILIAGAGAMGGVLAAGVLGSSSPRPTEIVVPELIEFEPSPLGATVAFEIPIKNASDTHPAKIVSVFATCTCTGLSASDFSIEPGGSFVLSGTMNVPVYSGFNQFLSNVWLTTSDGKKHDIVLAANTQQPFETIGTTRLEDGQSSWTVGVGDLYLEHVVRVEAYEAGSAEQIPSEFHVDEGTIAFVSGSETVEVLAIYAPPSGPERRLISKLQPADATP